MGVREDLIAAKALINTPEKWAHEESRRQENGGPCLCAVDAVFETRHWEAGGMRVLIELEGALPEDFAADPYSEIEEVAQFNDAPTTTHADIMALFDRAIAAAEVQS